MFVCVSVHQLYGAVQSNSHHPEITTHWTNLTPKTTDTVQIA